MAPPVAYDPNCPEEMPVPLPNAPIRRVTDVLSVQPPLSRRGHGPGIVMFLPDDVPAAGGQKLLDPGPVQKWAEEGFAVAFATARPDLDVPQILVDALNALIDLGDILDIKAKLAIIVYDELAIDQVYRASLGDERFACIIGYGTAPSVGIASTLPLLMHILHSYSTRAQSSIEAHLYPVSSASFVLPDSSAYDPGSAALAHSRSLVFLRKHLGGPHFDLEKIWEEHTYFEFESRSVAKTMGTMVAEPYVNHIPTMTGGLGRENLTRFYRDHFIFSNPADARLEVVSRTVGPDRVVDEFVYHITHDRQVDWLLPGVPETHKKLAIPMLAVVNIRGDRLYNEHIWWDQATVLKQAGILPTYVPYPTPEGNVHSLRLPVAGAESAEMLVDESKGKSNAMLGEGWGVVRNAA
ncbi:hypothetical protein D9611_002291 [Ephemerocybe angulata]|uniref:SnoaL-like domain-containing protein n=1 Tax=Ephemerocybe angulata TaxID=980116 RepID=A0A8H5C243_9AGAR|nr:hypothetical protein D9611_002291 [Tulosesus angulatus]